ncbi:MAG: hypothetical protein A2527_11495 [Candidatus Lambdaproteobacteria bacterium RIFOXYD2_FULL_50_16]|uniref:Phospholipase A1 n=1 Tax=Candidatus Lambdaproteobacteria bacterium RIFOXYD2_FULL_50_16 TaxID=1817772 RepID=A0A1F6G6K7_9PROT|nr:MAG: hypothetical protein A2527_11495 [Candidatus Lambdaproteobacteria bacterium RIFOXYD2_FULL_50_16]
MAASLLKGWGRLVLLLFVLGLGASNAQAQNQGFLSDLTLYKPNYLVWTEALGELGPYQNQEIIFQFSVQKPLWGPLHFAYSQKTFWQFFDQQNSRTFRTLVFNPELFLRFRDLWGMAESRLGLNEHESNGEGVRYNALGQAHNQSRSWNRSYLFGRWAFDSGWGASAKAWVVTDRKENSQISFYQDNPDIRDYLGNGELGISFELRGWRFGGLLRQGYISETTSLGLDASLDINALFPELDSTLELYLSAFDGYGDSLMDYNRRVRRGSVGFKVH